jgi:hypothetical protein
MRTQGEWRQMIGFAFTRDASALDRVDYRLGDWALRVADWLPVTSLIDDGAVVGLVIGWAVCPRRGRMIGRTETVDGNDLFRNEIYPLLGKYLAILQVDGETRVYLDGLGSLSVVFDAEAQMVGGTAADVMDDQAYRKRLDHELYAALEVTKDGWFPAGLTAHRGLERLMPNHYLDCETWATARHNAYLATPSAGQSAETLLDTIHGGLQATVSGLLLGGHAVSVGLTAGGDSRLILAALRDFGDRVEFYTVEPASNGYASSLDLVRARELASRHGLQHRILPFQTATEEQMLEWDRRVGHSVITANRRQFPSVFPLQDRICIGGLGGEVGRCFLWRDMERMPRIDAVSIVDLLKLPRVPAMLQRVEAWLERVPPESPHHILDLAYIELRMGSWSSSQSYSNEREIIIGPLGSFSMMEAMLALPPKFRQNDGFIREFIARYWPELLARPINRYGDVRDRLALLEKVTNPTKLYRKVRQKLRVG